MGGKPSLEVVRRAVRKHYAANRDAMKQKRRDYYKRNKPAMLARFAAKRKTERGKAGAKLRYAVWAGKIIKPEHCERCGDKTKLQGHHEDYSKPLEVIWLCQPCHALERRKN